MTNPGGDKENPVGDAKFKPIEVGMMCMVEAPQERHLMRHHVPDIEGVVQQHDAERDSQSARNRNSVQQAPALERCGPAQGRDQRLLQGEDSQSAKRGHTRVSRNAPKFSLTLAAQWVPHFHQHESAEGENSHVPGKWLHAGSTEGRARPLRWKAPSCGRQ
jgi:hypothetical protein